MIKDFHKEFKTFNEQLSILSERGLTFSNFEEKERMNEYLTKFGYRNIVTDFCRPFMLSFDLNTKKFDDKITASNLMDLVDLDINIGQVLLSKLFEIERKLSTSIAYYVMLDFKDEILMMKNGLISQLNENEFKQIFTYYDRASKFKPQSFNNDMVDFLTDIKDIDFTQLVLLYGKDKTKVPLWELAGFWTLGKLVQIYNILNQSSKQNVFYSFNTVRYPGDFNDFYSIAHLFQIIRNKLCHNRKIFDLNMKMGKKYILRFVENNKIKTKIRGGIRIMDIAKIIDKLNNNTSYSLTNKIRQMLFTYFKKSNLPPHIEQHIKENVNL